MNVSEEGKDSPQTNTRRVAPVFSRDTVVALTVIAGLWFLAVVIARPFGEFPLNDDWSWSKTAKGLAEGRGYHPTSWTEMTLLTNALWGALFCLPQGFSFTALRCSTLVLSLTGAFAMYALIRQLRPEREHATRLELHRHRLLAGICALTLAFNPIYFALSHTFMADVPFTTIALLSALFFVRHLRSDATPDLLIATAFALAATLSRQMGLCLPLAFGVTLWLKHGFQKRALIRAVLPALVCVVGLAAFQYWLQATGKPPPNTMRTDRLWAVLHHPLRIPLNVAYFGWSMLMYLGWFLLPVTLPAVLSRRPAQTGTSPCMPARIALFFFLLASVGRFVFVPALMPVHNNIIIPQGIGPVMLRDIFDLQLPHLPALPWAFWLLVTALSLAGAALLVYQTTRIISVLISEFRVAGSKIQNSDPATRNAALAGAFFLLCAVIYLVPFLLSGFFDRYLIPVTAFLAAFLAAALLPRQNEKTDATPHTAAAAHSSFFILPSSFATLVSLVLIAGMGIFGVVGTRDYLEWNRTRWKALDALLAKGDVKPQDVDGGFEFNGWHLYNDSGRTNNWTINGTYVIAFGDIKGYETVTNYSYAHWLPPHEGKIFVLKRIAGN